MIETSQVTQFQYTAQHKPNQLIYGNGQTAIITGWTVDPCGNFLIEVDGKEIIVSHTTSGSGEVIQCYRGKNPLNLLRDICANSPAIQPQHMGYLDIELQKYNPSSFVNNAYF